MHSQGESSLRPPDSRWIKETFPYWWSHQKANPLNKEDLEIPLWVPHDCSNQWNSFSRSIQLTRSQIIHSNLRKNGLNLVEAPASRILSEFYLRRNGLNPSERWIKQQANQVLIIPFFPINFGATYRVPQPSSILIQVAENQENQSMNQRSPV